VSRDGFGATRAGPESPGTFPARPRAAPAVALAAMLAAAMAFPACTIAPSAPSGQYALEREARATLARAQAVDPAFVARLHEVPAFAVFPSVGKGGAVIGFAYGKGVLYEHGRLQGWCDLSQGFLGFVLGGQACSEIIALETPHAVMRFKHGIWSLDAQANAVAFGAGTSTQGQLWEGVDRMIFDERGLMVQAAIGSQELRCHLLEIESQGDEPSGER